MTKFKNVAVIMVLGIIALTADPSFSQSGAIRPDEVIEIMPKPDRTLLVRTTRGYIFRYHIKDHRLNNQCGVYEKQGNQIKWMSHLGYQAFEYLTSDTPFAYMREGSSEWIPLSAQTYNKSQHPDIYSDEHFAEGVERFEH